MDWVLEKIPSCGGVKGAPQPVCSNSPPLGEPFSTNSWAPIQANNLWPNLTVHAGPDVGVFARAEVEPVTCRAAG
jgi:hypothetical protein